MIRALPDYQTDSAHYFYLGSNMNKYAIRLNGITKQDFLCALGFRDENFELDPEGNPTTVWVTTSVPMSDLLAFDGVEDVIEATG